MLLKCNFCHTRIKSKDSMKRHIESVHEGKRPFKCSICPSAFSQRNRLKVLFEISLCSKLQNRYCHQICNFEDFWTFSMYFDDCFLGIVQRIPKTIAPPTTRVINNIGLPRKVKKPSISFIIPGIGPKILPSEFPSF